MHSVPPAPHPLPTQRARTHPTCLKTCTTFTDGATTKTSSRQHCSSTARMRCRCPTCTHRYTALPTGQEGRSSSHKLLDLMRPQGTCRCLCLAYLHLPCTCTCPLHHTHHRRTCMGTLPPPNNNQASLSMHITISHLPHTQAPPPPQKRKQQPQLLPWPEYTTPLLRLQPPTTQTTTPLQQRPQRLWQPSSEHKRGVRGHLTGGLWAR